MSWAESLRALGFDVVFVDQIDSADCVDSSGRRAAFAASANASAFTRIVAAFGLSGDAALICADDGSTVGMSRDELQARMADSALLINLSGHLRIEALVALVPCRAFVDLDPAYTQIWHASGLDTAGLRQHQFHFSVGANVGGPDWTLPTGGVEWVPIRQPVLLERWLSPEVEQFNGFSTVASWRGAFGPAVWGDQTYGVKAHAFRRFTGLPALIDQRFSIVLDIDAADLRDRKLLEQAGWKIFDPEAAEGVEAFRRFVQSSGAEFSAAQDAYVRSRSGWFSDRTVRYLASGRPALVQDTGFSDHLPTGMGLVSFSDIGDAVAGARSIIDEYPRHCAAAREIAQRFFAPRAALEPLLTVTGVTP